MMNTQHTNKSIQHLHYLNTFVVAVVPLIFESGFLSSHAVLKVAIDQASLGLNKYLLPDFASQVLGLKACATMCCRKY